MLAGYQVRLEPVGKADLEMLRLWRNDPKISVNMLSQNVISKEQQLAWYRKIVSDESQQHFIIWYKDKPIGSANVKARGIGHTLKTALSAEPGLYIAEEKYRNNILAFAPTLLLNDYCFDTLGLSKLLAVVKSTNQAALNYNLKLGYRIEKQGELVEIALSAEDYHAHTQQIKALLTRNNRRTT